MCNYEMNLHDLLASVITGDTIDTSTTTTQGIFATLVDDSVAGNSKLKVTTGPNYLDSIGITSTALAGVTTYTNREFRTTDVVLPHIATNDILSYTFQVNHDKKLGTPLASFHLHVSPVGSTAASGSTVFTWKWGWYNPNASIDATLPNTGSTNIVIAAGTQYKHLVYNIITGITAPASEAYSSFFMVQIQRTTNVNHSTELALLGADCHYITKSFGSKQEYTD